MTHDRLKTPSVPLLRKLGLVMTVSVLSLGLLSPVSAQNTTDQTQSPPDEAGPPPTSPLPVTLPANATTDNAHPYLSSTLSDSDSQALSQAISAVKSRNFSQADAVAQGMSNPVARKIVTWAIINNDGNIYSFAALDAARRDLWGWPREAKRQLAAEKLITNSGMTAQQTVDWFKGVTPQSVDGATALITAYGNLGRTEDARALAKDWWTRHIFDSVAQANFYQAFGTYLSPDDHKARLTCLELNTQLGSSQAIRDMARFVDQHQADVANAVIAMRTGAASSDGLYQQALSGDPHNKVLAFARAKYLSGKGLENLGFNILPDLPQASASPDAASQLYSLRWAYLKAALKAHDYRAAYDAMNGGGFEPGEAKAEAEFFAGWIALTKLNNYDAAIDHFQALATAGTSPITQGRANYWLGRAYEARNHPGLNGIDPDRTVAERYYAKGGQYIYAFYGQMAAEKAGIKTLTIGKDPVPSQADRARFESRDQVKAARMLGSIGELDLFRTLVLTLDTVLPNAEEEVMLVDLAAGYDGPMIAMKVARMSMQRGFYIPERAFPVRTVPAVQGSEPAFALAIARQESSFDPTVRSHANARGLMQLIPSTARAVAGHMGVPYSESRLYEAEYNLQLGSYHLGELTNRFGGSYIMAAAGYNAGPSRMQTWVNDCGEPRGDGADALSFIECMPLRETRDYMMRVTENMRVYRARLNGGSAPLTAAADVTRGIPGMIGPSDPSDIGDGSGDTPDGPVSYLDYTKAQTQNPAAAQALSTPLPVTAPSSTVETPIVRAPAKPKPYVTPAKGKKAKATKASSSKKKTTRTTAKKTTKKKKH